MNNRERFLASMNYRSADHPPIFLSGAWDATLDRWHREGLKEGQDLYDYLELEPFRFHIPAVNSVLEPGFEETVLEEHENFVVRINANGVKVRDFKDKSSMPEFLEYPIRSAADLEWLEKRFDPENPARRKKDWAEKARKAQAEGAVLLANGGMFFGFLNEHMGTETLLFRYFDEPELIHRINELQSRAVLEAMKAMEEENLRIDVIGYHEDMAYKNGSMISPDLFREFMSPYYKKTFEQSEKMEVRLHFMDSDGNIEELIPLWAETGIRIMSPMEVAASMDPVRLRKKFGRELRMVGGFDKRILASTPAEISREFLRLSPVIEEGGYLVGCDHGVPPDVSLSNYVHFIRELKKTYGM